MFPTFDFPDNKSDSSSPGLTASTRGQFDEESGIVAQWPLGRASSNYFCLFSTEARAEWTDCSTNGVNPDMEAEFCANAPWATVEDLYADARVQCAAWVAEGYFSPGTCTLLSDAVTTASYNPLKYLGSTYWNGTPMFNAFFEPATATCAAGKVIGPNGYDCVDPEYFSEPPPQSSDCSPNNESNPCNPANGNKSQVEVDWAGSAATGISFARYYNSQGPYRTGHGMPVGWRHTYSRSLNELPDRTPNSCSLGQRPSRKRIRPHPMLARADGTILGTSHLAANCRRRRRPL